MSASEIAHLKAAVVGTGFIGVIHVDALRRIGIEVLGVVGSSPERAREKAREAPIPPPYESYEQMLEDDAVDVVHITSPNHLHHSQAKLALEAGKHVVCEKPLTMTSAESRDLLDLAERSGLVHATNFNLRFYPSCHEAQAMCRAGKLGTVWNAHGGYLQDWLLLPTDWNWRLEPEFGGELRVVGDIGSHWLDLMRFVTGLEIEEVFAEFRTFIPTRSRPAGPVETFADAGAGERVEVHVETEDTANILLRFAGGALGAMTVSQVSPGRKNHLKFEINGSEASVAWYSEQPEELWVGRRGSPNELLLRDPTIYAPSARATTTMPAGLPEGYADTFRELYRQVYQAIASGGPTAEPTYPTFVDGHEQLKVCEAIAQSAHEQRWIAVERDR